MKSLKLKDSIYWIGSLDPNLRVFDIIMYTEFGTTYNSYLVKGSDKLALIETVKVKFFDDYLEKIREIVNIDDIDYIVLNHTEPDHAGSVEKLLELNPNIKLVGSKTAINFMEHITNKKFESIIVKTNDSISLGDKTIKFYSVPFLHWPDSMYTYLEEDNVLFTCDSFGAHYCIDTILSSTIKNHEDYMKAAKYYFDMIMGPFKPHMLKALDVIENLKIDMICTGHGPIIDDNPQKMIDIYRKWSTEKNPNNKKTIIIPYVSSYGYTKLLSEKIEEGIKSVGDIDVRRYDLVETDKEKVLNEIYFADGLLFGTPTILNEALYPIWEILISIFPTTHSGKFASSFGSYGWSGEGPDHILTRLKQLRMKTMEPPLKVRFKPNDEQLKEAFDFGVKFANIVKDKK